MENQRVTQTSVGSSSATTPAFTATVSAGDLVVVRVMARGDNSTTTRLGITDSSVGGNTWVAQQDQYLDPATARIWTSKITNGSAAFTVTISNVSGTRALDVVATYIPASEWDGTTVTDGASVGGTGTGTAGTVAMNSTSVASSILLSCISFGDDGTHGNSIGTVQGTPAWGAGTLNTNATVRWESNYADISGGGPYTTPTAGWPSMTNPGSRSWAVTAIAIKGVTSGAARPVKMAGFWGGYAGPSGGFAG